MKNKTILFIHTVLLIISFESCNKGVKEIAKEGAEYVGQKAGKELLSENSSKTIGKNLLKESLKKNIILPSGKKTLNVIQIAPNKWIPEIDNLGKNALKFTRETNEKLLIERRKSISPYLQFPTADNINNLNAQMLTLGKPASGSILEKNMLISMTSDARKIVNAFGGKAAHHVVEGTDPLAKKSRNILQQFNVDINSPINGVFLPTDKNSIFKGTLHKTSHTKEYSEYVYNQIKDVKSKDELISILNQIKHDLFNGKITLEGKFHAINKNDINI